MSQAGVLYVVATPIGNLQDMSARALAVLRSVDFIAAEDTRHSARLLQHFNIKSQLLAAHQHNENQVAEKILHKLASGQQGALITDAGTPGISDPGHLIVRKLQQAGVRLVPIPGPCALVTALSVSGLPADQFVFLGFLAAKAAARSKQLTKLQLETRTMVFYEAPHRIMSCLVDMQSVFGVERKVVVTRELTKLYESLYVGSFQHVIATLAAAKTEQQGEFVIVVAGCEQKSTQAMDEPTLQVLQTLLSELPTKQAVALAAKITGKSKNKLYAWVLGRESDST
jgi:16S rRNA (cytidine1402-2'-O)-methyltransferase